MDMITPKHLTLGAVIGLALIPVAAWAGTVVFEGNAVIAAGSLNPPDPIAACNQAKSNAVEKASAAGTLRLVSWDRLSNDSDCSLKTQRAGSLGYYYIFTARGQFEE